MTTHTARFLEDIALPADSETWVKNMAQNNEYADNHLSVLIACSQHTKAVTTNSHVVHEKITAQKRVQEILDGKQVDQATIDTIKGLMEGIAAPVKLAMSGVMERVPQKNVREHTDQGADNRDQDELGT